MSRHPKSIIEDIIDSLKGTEQDYLVEDLKKAWSELPSQAVQSSDSKAQVMLSVEDQSRAESLYSVINQLCFDLAHELDEIDIDQPFPGEEAREESIADIKDRLQRLSELTGRDSILFSQEKMPDNHFAVSVLLKRSPQDS
jgi:hypothetical protein